MNNTKEKFDLVYASTQSLRDAKRETIHFMGRVGRRFKKLRYPIFLFTVLFVFIYNVFLYAFIALRVKDKMARALALAMTAILVLTSIDITAFAMSSKLELKETSVIVGFKELEEDIRIQKLTVGDTEDGIRFPNTLTATIMIEQHNDEMEQIENPVPEFSTIPGTETEEVSDVQESITSEQDETFGAEDTLNEEESVTPEPEETRDTDETENLEPEEQGGDTPEEIPNETENQQENEGEPEPEAEPEVETETDSEPEPEENLVSCVTDFLFPAMTVYAAEETPLIEETEIGESEIAVSWVLDTDRSSKEVFSSEQEGDAFVYVPVLPDGYCIAEDVSVPEIWVVIENKELSSSDAFAQSMILDGIEISVYAPAGVFPAGAFLDVKMITNEAEVSEIEQLVSEKKDETTSPDVTTVVEQSYSFDITIRNESGTEIEPDTSKGQVSVTFKNVGVIETEQQEDKELSVFYVSDDYQEAEELSHDTYIDEDSASIMAEHFSIYTVVITTETNVILPYYQGTSKAASYFTVYNEEQLIRYRDLLNDYVDGKVTDANKIATILVNADDANPMDGITGLGQATNMTVADLNFSVKIMDDITVSSEWTPINKIPSGVTFNGGGHTIIFESLADGVTFSTERPTVLVTANEGSVINVTLCYENLSFTAEIEEEEDSYATVTVRVDGQKAEIGEAITGAEALAASCDGINYITLKRSDDLSVYRTELVNLEEGKEYNVYYVYEDENETISAATITKENPKAELNYVSVSYELEGANTYKLMEDGTLSENIMAAIRVDVKENGTVEAQEDYESVVKAIDGYEIPTRERNVTITVDGTALVLGTDYTYTYNAETKLGTIFIHREKITGPVFVKVKADSLEDNPPNKVILKTRGGSISDPLWEKTDDGDYVQEIFETDDDIELPKTVKAYKESDAIRFDGWYTDSDCIISKVDKHTYKSESTEPIVYYAKWVLNKTSSLNNSVYYQYKNGNLEVQGYPPCTNSYTDPSMITYNLNGFSHLYWLGELKPEHINGTKSGEPINMVKSENTDIFMQIGSSEIYVALICTLENNLLDITYMFENRGEEDFNSKLYFGVGADVKIAGDDSAKIEIDNTDGGSSFIKMTNNSTGKQFRLYSKGADYGIDEFYSFWFGNYSSRNNYMFAPNKEDLNYKGDSGLSFSWCINNIPAGGYTTKTTKMGLAKLSVADDISVTLNASPGQFPDDGRTVIPISSDMQSIKVNADGTINAANRSGNTVTKPPIRTGYIFDYWSIGKVGGKNCTNKTLTESVTLYANWVPKPDKSVTNNSSVQKVNGSSNLLVPEALANIVIKNTTPGATTDEIKQGKTAVEAAGYASGFTGTLVLEGEDDRYLLPDNIEVTITDDRGVVTKLTKGTGYTYQVYDNRRKADLEIKKRYINGNVTITAVGYELPPVTATSVEITVPNPSIKYGERAVFTASAETSKNHVASYQWYVAPYYEIELDNQISWTYQNQDGIALTNGVHEGDEVCLALNASGNPVTITGANKATLRITGLDVNTFSDDTPGESMDGLRYGGYHVYCKVTSTRNITGQEIVAVSDTAELQVDNGKYEKPSGLEGSATTYKGGSDGSISIAAQSNRPALLYKKSTDSDSMWKQATAEQLAAGEISGLSAGTYQFMYQADSNHEASDVTDVTVEDGRSIIVTYRAPGCDDTSLRTQYKHVAYGSTVTAVTPSLVTEDGAIREPARKGYTFSGWEPATITNITEDTTVTAVYTYGIYQVTLNNQGATKAGTEAVYEKYSAGFYRESTCVTPVNGTTGITLPEKDGYQFLGYFTQAEGGIKMINADGCLSQNMSTTMYLGPATLYAHWEEKPVSFNVLPDVNDPESDTPGGEDPGTDTPGVEPNPGIEITIEPTDPDTPGTGEEDPEYHASTSYNVTVTNNTGKDANVIYIYSDGELKRTLSNVVFDENNEYTFQLIPSEVGGGTITFAVGYVNPETEEGEEKTEEQIKEEAEEQAQSLNYAITYKEVNGSSTGTAFSGSFLNTAPSKGVKGVATTLPKATRTGYTFGGWYTAPRGTGRAITEIPASNTSDEVTVYAKWIANKYTINLELNGGSFAQDYTPAEQYQHGGDDILLPDETQIAKENHVFLGWFENADLTGDAVTKVDASQVGTVTYYAGWELLSSHIITLTEDGLDGQQYILKGAEGYGYIKDDKIHVYHGQPYQFTVEVKPAYKLKAVKANGKLVTETDGIYIIPAVTEAMTITAVTEQLVSTDEAEAENAEAKIHLPDGTDGFFETLAEAIDYAAQYGSNSKIELLKDLSDTEIDAVAGNSYSIDLNGHTVTGTMLIEDGATVTLQGESSACNLSVENRGKFTINEGITINELLNLSLVNNRGTVISMTQQESESGEMSRFENHGTVESAVLESGCFVENVLENAPEGLTGYTTIMNGNEYYVAFADAVDIANASGSDATILMLSTVDNRNSTIEIANQNGKAITVDLNSYNISGGELQTGGATSFINGKGSATCISEITASIDNTGDLTIGDYVKVGGALVNEEGGKTKVEEKAAVSGPVTNKGDFVNDGDITGIYTNESGHTKNSETGTMNNVIQKGGDFDNDGEIKTKLELEGGSYTPSEGATPGVPEGAVAKSNTNPVTYYGTFKDAVEDANDPETSGAEGQEQPFTITLIKDVSNDDLGEAPIILDPDVPVNINLNNHKLGDEGSGKQIQIGNPDGGESAGQTVTIQNQPENGDSADPEKGNVNTPVKVEDGGSLDVDKGVSLEDVDNDGRLKVEKDGTVEKLSNQGDTENNGKLGDTTQNGGNLKNGETGKIDKLTQKGGNTDNQGTITDANIEKGGYTGDKPEKLNGETPSTETDGKVAKITPPGGGDPIYFVSLDDALEYAAGMDNGPVTVELLKDVTDESIDFTTTKTPVILDLKGHSIKPSSAITTGEGTDLTITDSLDGKKGKVEVPVTNNGRLANESEITGSVTNNGDFDNKGKVTGDVAQKGGTYTNEDGATTKKIIQTGGETINKDTPDDGNGGIEAVDLQRGSYEGAQPTNGGQIDSEAKIGDKLYGDLESAIEDANEADNDVTIELTKKVELPDTPPLVIDNENGHNINIDLKGNDITGGELQIGSGDSGSGGSPSGKVTFTDSSTLGEKGTIGSDIKVKTDGDLTLGKDVTTFGNVDNAGKISNNGIMKAPGTVTNTGDMENNGDIETKVEQKEGTFTNGKDGKVKEVEQTGGTLDNKNPNGIENATVSDGEFKGDPATNMNYEGAKVAVITQNPDGTTKTTYYSSIEEAINNTDRNVILQLIDDVKDESSEDILINKPGITLDLNGHEIGTPSKLTVGENATDTKIADSSEGGNGKVTAPVDNKGNLTIDEGVKAESVSNSGTLNNKGEITTLTNKGNATNSGTIGTLKQESGNMQNDGTIQSVEFAGGGYEGENPETPIDNPVAKIGDKLYADLESAIEDANKSSEDATIKVLQNTTLPKTSIGNENGNKITLDLNGKTVAGGPLTVKAPGVTEITDSSELGDGSLKPSVQVDAGAKLVIDGPANVCGDIENQGTTENHGHAAGDVTNKSGGSFVNDGDITGDVNNEKDANFTNRGENSYVGGDVENAGHMSNEGVIGGEVDNTGNLDNNGNIDNNVTNRGNGKLDNDGKVNGQLENKENATTDNSGYINQVKQTGGEVTNSGEVPDYLQNGGDLTNSAGGIINQLTQTGGHTENAGTIDTVETSDIKNFNGNKPSEGLPGVKASVTYIDENGKEKTEYFTTFEKAMEKAGEGNPDGTTPTKITLVTSPFVVDEELTIPDGVTLEVPEGNTLQITENGKLINRGTIQVDTGANLEIEQGGSLTNQSTMVNNGTLENAGELKNESQGTINNAGDISNTETGEFTNEGKIDNKNGSLNGSNDSAGNIINNGSITGGTVSGPLENGTTGVISGSDKLLGQIKNEGKIEVSSGQVSAGADIENLPGSSFVNIEETKNQNNKPGDSQADGDSSDEESSDNDTTEETVAVIKKPLVLPLQISEIEESSGQSAETNTFNRLNRPERDNTESEAPAGTTENVQNATSEENAAEQKAEAETEDKPIMIHNLDEAEGIVIVKNQVVLFGKGTVEFEVESTDCNVKADLKMLLQSCFTEEELERIEKGENAVSRVSVVKVAETVSPQDKKVVEEQLHILEKTIKGLQFGQYIEIYVECKIGDSEWRQVHELSGDMTLEITVPDELLKNERTYYVLRNHEGACDLLEDLDDEPTTVTIATNKFSTYALLYVDNDTAEESMMGWVWFLVGGSVLLLFLIFLFLKRKKEEEERA